MFDHLEIHLLFGVEEATYRPTVRMWISIERPLKVQVQVLFSGVSTLIWEAGHPKVIPTCTN